MAQGHMRATVKVAFLGSIPRQNAALNVATHHAISQKNGEKWRKKVLMERGTVTRSSPCLPCYVRDTA